MYDLVNTLHPLSVLLECLLSGWSSLVLRSEGKVREEQADVLGVYRLVDSHQARPLYKQDGGENFIFFSPAPPSWVVGTVVGSQYGWLRNISARAGEARWPGSLEQGWQYRDSLSATWREDDVTLRIQALPGIVLHRSQ